MRCHYEVLNVPRDADLAEIKTAYKKLALKWHPDKNLNNQEHAKEQFQVVQQAYEVLSDRQERAWYDNHREQILKGSNSGYEDNCLDVFQYFSTSCFKGYGDGDEGFYSVYRSVFEKIAKEDMDHMENKEEFCNIPEFGNSQSDYEHVVKLFYDYWMNYSTKKSYVWLDPYNINEIRDRRSVKLAEKENKKVRQQARKERNEEVRALVAFVRKRDKRVQAHSQQMEAKRLENKQKMEQLKLQKKLERKAQLDQESAQPEWAKFDNFKSELIEIEKNLAEQFCEELSNSENDEEEEEEDENNLYCVACNKVFKTPKTFKNHELSKKHRENVAALKDEMWNEEEEQILHEESGIVSDDVESENISEEEEEKETKQMKKKQRNKVIITQNDEETEISLLNDVIHLDVSDSDLDFNVGKQKKKKAKKAGNKKASKAESSKPKEDSDENNFEAVERMPKKKSKKQAAKFDDAPIDISHCCVTCKSAFSSKNKLFDHLKKSGHSVYVSDSKITQAKQKTKCVK